MNIEIDVEQFAKDIKAGKSDPDTLNHTQNLKTSKLK